MKQGEIYWINLEPTKGSEQGGKRPAVIVSGNSMNEHLGIVLACPISGSIKGYPTCVPLEPSKSNGLKKASEIITFQIRSVSKSRLGRKLGLISDKELRDVKRGLVDVITY